MQWTVLPTSSQLTVKDENKGYDINPKFSPDGKYIAWQSMERDGYESDRNRLCVMDLGSKEDLYYREFRIGCRRLLLEQ